MTGTSIPANCRRPESDARRAGFEDPSVQWLLDTGWTIADGDELTRRFAGRLVAEGVPLRRLTVLIHPAHPQVEDAGFTWHREAAEAETNPVPQAVTAAPRKPLAMASDDGAIRVHGRIEHTDPDAGGTVPERRHARGAGSCVTVPMALSDGALGTVAFDCDASVEFSDCETERFRQSAAVLARLLDTHTVRRTARKLLQTYLGKRTGGQILQGRIQRGSGDDIHAVLWFCDLRDSTAMADAMPRRAFLGVLNDFFDCTAGAALDHGGEVLRFIGDASLAIFPTGGALFGTGGKCCDTVGACLSALAAARDAQNRLRRLNLTRERRGDAPLRFGLALHMGDVTYGNVGVAERMEFTVIGAAANHAARLQDLCKVLNQPILISAEFKRCFPGQLRSLGRHPVHGGCAPEEIFTLPASA